MSIDTATQSLVYACELFAKYDMRLFCENNELYAVLEDFVKPFPFNNTTEAIGFIIGYDHHYKLSKKDTDK